MKKNLAIIMTLAVIASLLVGFSAFANCGKCPSDKAGKGSAACKHGDSKDGCKSMAKVDEAVKALEADLAKMDKEMSPADQAAFLKAHKENLKKFLDARTECMKACKAHEEKNGEAKKD